MNTGSAETEIPSPSNLDDVGNPRKRARAENSARKSWSLMDRRTDEEVLQEMGVSLLDPDDAEEVSSSFAMHKSLQRTHDIENVNPNVNSSLSSPLKHSPRSPRVKLGVSPGSCKHGTSPGSSKLRSPRSGDKLRPLQQSEQLETTVELEYPIDEETPLAQSTGVVYLPQGSGFDAVTTSGRKRHSFTPLGLDEHSIMNKRHKSDPTDSDSFEILSDEMLLSVFKWLPKRTLAHCMLVCKRWQRVAYDETLWQRLDLGNKSLNRDALGRILARKPIIVRLASSEIGEWHPAAPRACRIQYLDLSMCTIDVRTLDMLIQSCPVVKKLSLESVQLQNSTCDFIGKCKYLETLNLTMAQGVTDVGLTSILGGCVSVQSLNISWCGLSEGALRVLVGGLPTRLQRLNLGGARILTDDMVSSLTNRCPGLLELDLSDCSRLTASAITALGGLTSLEHLALSRCYLLPAQALTKLVSMASLQYLEVWGMFQSGALSALRAAMPAIQINLYMFSAIARPTVGNRRTSIWGLRTRD